MAKTKYNTIKRTTTFYHDKVEKLFKKLEEKLKRPLRFTTKRSVEAIIFLIVFFAFFGLLAYKMSLPKIYPCSPATFRKYRQLGSRPMLVRW